MRLELQSGGKANNLTIVRSTGSSVGFVTFGAHNVLLGDVLSQGFLIRKILGLLVANVTIDVGLLAVRNQRFVFEEVTTLGVVAQLTEGMLDHRVAHHGAFALVATKITLARVEDKLDWEQLQIVEAQIAQISIVLVLTVERRREKEQSVNTGTFNTKRSK